MLLNKKMHLCVLQVICYNSLSSELKNVKDRKRQELLTFSLFIFAKLFKTNDKKSPTGDLKTTFCI